MADEIALMRLVRLQERVFRCIEDEISRDPVHKSYEGAMEATLTLPPIFHRSEKPSWMVTLSAYVLPMGDRHRSWKGETLMEAVSRAESGLETLLTGYEMARLSREMDMCCDEPGEDDGSRTIYAATRDQMIPE